MMDTVHVKVGGKDRPVRFGNRAMSIFARETGASFGSVSQPIENWRVDHLFALFWAGLTAGAQKEGAAFDASVDDVADWCDDPAVVQDMFRAFQAAQPKPDGDDAGKEGNATGR